MKVGIASALVTGATGFIGSSLARRLAREGARVTCPVRSSSPRAAALDAIPNLRVVPLDAFTPSALAEALHGASAEVVFHLASYGVDPGERDPEHMIEGNVTLVTRLLGATAPLSPSRFVFAGSCSEYAPALEPQRIAETHPVHPQSMYGAAKAAARLYGDALARRLGIHFVTLRPFGVYGPGEAPHRLIPHLLDRLTRDDPPDLTPGEQARDLTYVDDMVEAFLLAATARGIEPHHAYNACTGDPVKIREVAEMVTRRLEKPNADLGLGRRPYRGDEPMWVVGDGRRFREATGWQPRVGLAEGIDRMIAAAREGAQSEAPR
jgi:UDP-glucose 4-epimerase